MPITVEVEDFPDQTGETEADAITALEAVNPDVLIVTTYSSSLTVPSGTVIMQTTSAVAIEEAGGPAGSHGVQVTLVVSTGTGSVTLLASRWTGAGDPVAAAAAEAAAAAPSRAVQMVCFVYLDFPDYQVRVSDAGCNLVWGGFTWAGLGYLGSIEPITESLEVLAQPVRLALSGVESQYIAAAMDTEDNPYHGRDATIWVGLLDPYTLAFISEPEETWSGYMDVVSADGDHNSCVIRVDCEHRLRRLAAVTRYTDENQRAAHPTDTFFDHLYQVKQPGKWGARDTNYAGGGGGRNPGPRQQK